MLFGWAGAVSAPRATQAGQPVCRKNALEKLGKADLRAAASVPEGNAQRKTYTNMIRL
jgi:hypothetical protein